MMKEETKKRTTKKKATKPKLPAGIEAEDWHYLQQHSKRLTIIRTTAVVSGLDGGTIGKLWSIYKKYHPQDKGKLQMGCNSCVFKSLVRVAKWVDKLGKELK